jgi:DNA-binding GntR family transcriptional regulator
MQETAVARVRSTTADATLAERLIADIVAARFAPGTPLREQEIATAYGVSRPTTREALRLAAQAGFVDINPFRGARIVEMSFEEFLDISVVLEGLYGRCAALAARRASGEAIDLIDAKVEALVVLQLEGADKLTLSRKSYGIGRLVAEAAASPMVYRLLVQAARLTQWQQALHQPGTYQTETQHIHVHRLLVSALRGRQPEVARAAAELSVRITRLALIDQRASEALKIV